MTKRSKGLSLVAALLFGAAALGSAPHAASADGGTCGGKENPCPLQKWMKVNIGTPMAAGDLAAVSVALEKAASMSPDPAWGEWAASSKAGAAAAKKGDLAATKASCKSCHEKYKDAYKEKFRARLLP